MKRNIRQSPRALLLLPILLVVAGTGCGTLVNLQGGDTGRPEVFGGVGQDVGLVGSGFELLGGQGGQGGALSWMAHLPIACTAIAVGTADIPLSLVGDAVTMPAVVIQRKQDLPAAGPPVGTGGGR
jgi:uncharacterized protein YceK